jgi:hypothetical protein
VLWYRRLVLLLGRIEWVDGRLEGRHADHARVGRNLEEARSTGSG